MSNIIKLNENTDFDGVCIFKSIENAERFVANSQILREEERYPVVCLQATDNESLSDSVITLSKEYETLMFITDKNNFSQKELIEYCHYLNNVIYECKEQDIKLEAANPFFISELLCDIKNAKSSLFSYEIEYSKNDLTWKFVDFFSFDNKLIKIYTKKKFDLYRLYSKVATNYAFEINKIIICVDENNNEEHNVELKITDAKGNSFSLELPAKKKNNLEYFRQALSQKGNFFDCFTKTEFNQLLHQLCSQKEYPTVYKYNNPGYIADRNVWLFADGFISLDDNGGNEYD